MKSKDIYQLNKEEDISIFQADSNDNFCLSTTDLNTTTIQENKDISLSQTNE